MTSNTNDVPVVKTGQCMEKCKKSRECIFLPDDGHKEAKHVKCKMYTRIVVTEPIISP
jgi:hypothetical protein